MQGLIKGLVFNIQHFSIHDGVGIRSVVFLKGCPLRCAWCANPESQSFKPEAGWTGKECIGCKECVKRLQCLSCRFEGDELFWDRDVSLDMSDTEIKDVCPTEAFHRIGRFMTVAEVLDEGEKDLKFYENSEGGITLSGGEPLAQAEFAIALLEEAGKRHLRRNIESCGFVHANVMVKAAYRLDTMYMDVKLWDEEKHKKWTGVSNRLILDNLRNVARLRPDLPITIRTPVIPGVNDNVEELSRIAEFAHSIGAGYEMLKYHRLGLSKYRSLHREYPMGDVELSEERFRELKSAVEGK